MDCFALTVKGGCKVLTEKRCLGKCSFKKTEDEQASSLEKAKTRLRSLPKIEQQTIADRYYGGTVRW